MTDRARAFPDITWENLAVAEAHDRRRQHASYRGQVTPQLAQRTADLSFAYPNVPSGAVVGMAAAGIDPFTPEAEQVRSRSQELADAGLSWVPKKQSFWDVGLGKGIKGFTRGAFTLFESLYDETVKGTSAFIYGLGQGKDIGEAASGAYGFSPGALALSSAIQGKPVNLGSGFFAGGDLSGETQQALDRGVPYREAIQNRPQMEMGLPAKQHSTAFQQESFQKLAGTEDIEDPNTGIRGLTLTPGRFVAASVTEPGSSAFNQLSGATDFASNIFLDPSNAAFGWVGDVRSLNKALVAGPRSTVLRRNVTDWLASGHGNRTAEFIANTDDYRLLHGLFRKNAVQSNVDASMIYALSQESDPNKVKEILSAAVRGGSSGQLATLPVPQSLVGRATGTSGLGGIIAEGMGFSDASVIGLRQAVKANRATTSFLGRMGAEVGAKALRFDDISTATDDLGQWLQAAGVDPDTISSHMGQMASILPGQADTSARMWGTFKAAGRSIANKMIDDGLDKEIAEAAVRAFSGTPDDYRKFWIDQAGNPTMFAGSEYFHMVNGDIQAIPSAQLFSEFMDWGIPLPDMRKIRNGLRRAKWADWGLPGSTKKLENVRTPDQVLPRFRLRDMEGWDDLGPGVLTQLTDKVVQGVWKPLVLLRVAWPVRVVAEEQVRMGAIGLSSAINHPIHWLSMAFGRNMAEDVLGNPIQEMAKFRAAMSRKGVEFGVGSKSRDLYSSEWHKVDQTDPRWWDGQAISLQQIADDPLTRRIAKAIHEADEALSFEEILKPIKDEFSTEGTELGRLRDALAVDSGRWDLVNIRTMADSVIDDRLARLLQYTGGDYVKANHVSRKWEDAWGNPVHFDADQQIYVNAKTGQTYNFPPPGPRAEYAVNEFPDLVEQSGGPLRSLVERRQTTQRGYPMTDDPIELGEWADSLEDFHQTLTKMSDPQSRRIMEEARHNFGEPRELAKWIDDNAESILAGDMAVTAELGQRIDNITMLMEEARRYGTRVATPSGQPDFQAVDLIQMSGQPDLVRQSLSGYNPLPGQLSIDELADKDSWTLGEIADMIGPDIEVMGKYPVHPMPKSLRETHGKGTHVWTEPIDPARPRDGEIVQIAHDGVITGHIEVNRGPNGEIEDIGILHTARPDQRTVWYDPEGNFYSEIGASEVTDLSAQQLPGSNTDAQRLLSHVLGGETDPSAIYDLAFGGVPIREWLSSAGHNVEGLTMADMAEFMRAQLGAQWAGKAGPLGGMPSIALSPDGAAMMARTIRALSRRSKKFKGSPASWPQAGMTTHAVRPPKAELLEAVATGSFGGHKLSAMDLADESEKVARISDVSAALKGRFADEMADLPQYTKVASPADTKRLDRAVDHLFEVFGSRPTNKLSRSPAFRQFYYNRVGELLPYVDNATRDDLVRAMRENGVRRADIKEHLKKAVNTTGELDATDVDDIAKAFALQETKRLLYDLTKKTQFYDITRNLFPFGEAWHEIMTTWGRIINENPQVIRRLQQGIEGARHEGIFYNDPATGEEVFAMPHLNALSSLMGVTGGTGQATPQFTGRVEGVNLVLNNFLPGVGPTVQMPAAAFARDVFDKPELRWARDLVFPFGYPEADSPGALVNSVMPAWFKKAMTAIGKPSGDDQRLYNNTVIDVLRAMELNGEITPQSDPVETLELARSRARNIYVLRFAQQFVGPTGASVRWDVEVDPTGEAYAYQVLATEYRQMIEDADGDRTEAFQNFVNVFGFEPAGIATPKTESVRPRSVTEEGLDFQQQNPELFERFDLTAYYAAPDPPDGEFNYNAYLAQLRRGDRVGLTPDQWLTERNRLLGSLAYEKLRRAAVDFGVRNDPKVASYLRAYRYNLMEQYPGYGFDNVGVVSQPERRQFMAEFEEWRTHDQLSQTNAGQGLIKYLELRDYALVLAENEMGVSEEGFAEAKSTSLLREFLMNAGRSIVAEYPDFGVIFQRHYLWEVEDPEPVAPTELLGVDLSGPDPDDDEE